MMNQPDLHISIDGEIRLMWRGEGGVISLLESASSDAKRAFKLLVEREGQITSYSQIEQVVSGERRHAVDDLVNAIEPNHAPRKRGWKVTVPPGTREEEALLCLKSIGKSELILKIRRGSPDVPVDIRQEAKPMDPTAWEQYRSWFQSKMREPAFGMELIGSSASLLQLYIPLRICPHSELPEVAARSSDTPEIDPSRLLTYAIDAQQGLTDWASSNLRRVVVQGHPGSGKSSLVKMFVHEMLEKGGKIIFIPLQRVRLAPLKESAATTEVLMQLFDEAIADSGVRFSDLLATAGQDLIIVLDALDELQLLDGKDLAEGFLTAMWAFERNHDIRTIITTRHLSAADVQGALGKAERFEVLRYFFPFHRDRKYENPEKLATQHDYRDDWWRKFGEVVDRSWKGMPQELQRSAFDEFTCDPFNNLMAAIAFLSEGGRKPIHRISELYERILVIVQKRGFETVQAERVGPIHALPAKHFELLLQDVALAAWPNGGRVASMSAIESAALAAGHREGYQRYIRGAYYGESNILLQFYFRNPNEMPIDETKVEFTHKSFSDWLVTRKLVDLLREWIKGRIRIAFDDIVEWLAIGSLLPEHVILLHSELGAWDKKQLETLGGFLEEKLTHIGDWGFDVVTRAPGTMLHPNTSNEWQPQLHFGYIKTSVRNIWIIADIARFELNQGNEQNKRLFSITPFIFTMLTAPNWKDSLGGHFRNVDASRISLAGSMLNHLLLDGRFETVDFENANLTETVFDESQIANCNFKGAILRHTSFEDTAIKGSSFVQCLALNATFDRAKLDTCDFGAANLFGTTFEGAELKDCKYLAADLRDAKFTDARIDDMTNFEGAQADADMLAESLIHSESGAEVTLTELGWRLVNGRITRRTDKL